MIWIIIVIIAILFVIGAISTNSEKKQKTYVESNLGDISETEIGVGFENYDEFELKGVHVDSRKGYILANCSEYDDLFLIHDERNEYSKTAIVVYHSDDIIGYLPDESSSDILDIIKHQPYKSYIANIHYFDGFLDVSVAVEW